MLSTCEGAHARISLQSFWADAKSRRSKDRRASAANSSMPGDRADAGAGSLFLCLGAARSFRFMTCSYGGISGAVLVRQLPPYIPASSAAPKGHFLRNGG